MNKNRALHSKSTTARAICSKHIHRHIKRTANALGKRNSLVRETPFNSFPLKPMHRNQLLNAGHAHVQNAVDSGKGSFLPGIIADGARFLSDDMIGRSAHVVLEKDLAAIQHCSAFRGKYGTSTASKSQRATKETSRTHLC